MSIVQLVEFDPYVLIFYRLFTGSDPAFPDPSLDPLSHSLDQILGVRGQLHLAGFLQLFQGNDCRSEFHDVVGGILCRSS